MTGIISRIRCDDTFKRGVNPHCAIVTARSNMTIAVKYYAGVMSRMMVTCIKFKPQVGFCADIKKTGTWPDFLCLRLTNRPFAQWTARH